MRTPALYLLLATALPLTAQHVEWLQAKTLDYDLNPEMPRQVLCVGAAGHLYAGRALAVTYLYNDGFGPASVDRIDTDGGTLWSFAVGDSVVLQSIAAGPDGTVIVGGRFFHTIHLADGTVIDHLYDGQGLETFLFALDAEGQLLWHRNLTPPPIDEADVSSITFDHLGRAWYSSSSFFAARLARLNTDGSDAEERLLDGAKQIGDLSFDPWGGLYVSGAASVQGVTVNGTHFPVDEQYAFFVTRMDATGHAQWLQYAHDVTFQRPRVVADRTGHAYLTGSPFDDLSWGDIAIHGPQWNSTMFLMRLDSTGVFEWGVQPPETATITGQFDLAHDHCIGVDEAGDVHLLGITSGTVEWGNGVVTTAGVLTTRTTTLLRFNDAGIPQWQLNGGSASYDVVRELTVSADGTCHIGVSAGGVFNLGDLSVDVGEDLGLIVARIDALNTSTGFDGPAVSANAPAAQPSLFSEGFRVSGGALDASRPVLITVFDTDGRVVERATDLRLPLGLGLQSGAYIADVRQNDARWRLRVVKSH